MAPQLMPAGFDVTVPLPVPAFATVRVYEAESMGLGLPRYSQTYRVMLGAAQKPRVTPLWPGHTSRA